MKCVVCKKEIEKSKYLNADLCSSECFHEYYWMEKIKVKDKPGYVRVNGFSYFIGPEEVHSYFRGYGGRRFVIEFFDGRRIVTTNLWANGPIPEQFREILTDNARFITEEEANNVSN